MRAAVAVAISGILALLPGSVPQRLWRIYAFRHHSFQQLTATSVHPVTTTVPLCPFVRPDWHVPAAILADVTGDEIPEWALVVWRPWRDWPIQQWSSIPSPIVNWHDAQGDSCHLILLDPRDGRQIWAGSALPAPILAMAVGDVNGDTHNEVVTLEGSYAAGRNGPAAYATVWSWNGFGFTLEWRSPPGLLRQLWLTDADGDGILDIVVY